MTASAQAHILANALDAYCVRHGLATWRVGVYLFRGARNGIARLRTRKRPTERVLNRVRAFLDAAPPPGLHRHPCGGPRKRRDCSTGEHLALKLDALIAEHHLLPRRVAVHLFNSPHGIERLRTMKPQKRTVARVNAFLARPDIAALREPPTRKTPRLRVPPITVRAAPRPPLTFEQQLALVASGKARVVRKLVVPGRVCDRSLVGCAGGMVVDA